jgi:hypothetical protein
LHSRRNRRTHRAPDWPSAARPALPHLPKFEPEPPLTTLISGDLALTSTPPKDGAGARAQVVRRQPDGSWLRLIDRPEFTRP